MPTLAHSLSVEQILHLLQNRKVDAANCIIIHPTDDTVMSFDMLSGTKRFMFSDGRSYFTDVLKSLSLNRVIESTIVRSFFDSYTAKQVLSDWNRMDNDTRSLFQKQIAMSRLFIGDIKRMLKSALEDTMYSLHQTCNIAQRTLIEAMHFHAVLNMVPCKPVTHQHLEKGKKQIAPPLPITTYSYEHHIAHACMETERGVCMTHSVPPQEDTVIVYNRASKKASAFLYEEGELSPLEVIFFGALSHETFTRRGSQRHVQTHSLCENVLPLERYLHGIESTHMKVLKDLAFRSTIIMQNLDDVDAPLPKKSKHHKDDSGVASMADSCIAQHMKEYRQGLTDNWQPVQRVIKEIASGSRLAENVPLSGHNVTVEDLNRGTNTDAFGNVGPEASSNVLRLVHGLQRKRGPLGGREVESSLAHIESDTSKLQKDFIKQQETTISLQRALSTYERTHAVVCGRNEALMEELLISKSSHGIQTRAMTKTQEDLAAAQAQLQHIRSTLVIPQTEPNNRQDDSTGTGLRANVLVDVENQDDYNAELSGRKDSSSIRYVNVSDCGDTRVRYLNANFAVPPVDPNIREAARKAWGIEVRSRFFLRDYVHPSTGTLIERQPSYDTTAVYLGGFCRQFMNFRMLGRVVFDWNFMSQKDTVEHMFTCESEGAAIHLLNMVDEM